MTASDSPETIVAEGIQWWLEKEAGSSTFDQNKGLDNLAVARQAIVGRADPKVKGHIRRMELWLSLFGRTDLRSSQTAELAANVAFGALMFLSGTYRRQRYLQAADQNDYYQRKLEWRHPGSVILSEFLPHALQRSEVTGVEADDVKMQGLAAIAITESSIRTMYDRAPADFGQDESVSSAGIRLEQLGWLTFLSKSLRHASNELSLPLENTPVLEPKPITLAQPTTLQEVLATKS